MKMYLGLLPILVASQLAGAAETVSGRVGTSRDVDGADFSREVSCGSALAVSDLVASHSFHVVPGRGILFSGQRAEQLGFYTFGPKGAAFNELRKTPASSENLRSKTFHVKVAFPGTEEKTSVVYKQSRDSWGELGLELKDGQNSSVLDFESANDLFAEKALVSKLTESIGSIPKNAPAPGSMMFPNLAKLNRQKAQNSLSKIVCGCKGLASVQEAIGKMRASKEMKIYDMKFPCESVELGK